MSWPTQVWEGRQAAIRARRMNAWGGTGARLRVSGKQLLLPSGAAITLRGMNQGTWGENFEQDAADIKATGANCIRTVFRWWGPYGTPDIDSRTARRDSDYINARNLAQLKKEIRWAQKQGLWVVVAFDSNCGQSGIQDAGTIAYCDPAGQYPGTGRNFFTDLETRAFFKKAWQRLALELQAFPNIAMFEILPEPLDGRDATWSDDNAAFYRDVIDAIRQVDKKTPFLIGARDSYNILVADEAFLAERQDVVYTGNLLSGRVTNQLEIHNFVAALVTMRDARNVPILVQQVGRRSADDVDLSAMNGVLSLLNAHGVHYTWWQWHQNTANPAEYAVFYKDGVGGWIAKAEELATLTYFMQQTFAQVEAAAIAAATAAGALLYYIKQDLSNVWQDNTGTLPVTAAGQTIGRLAPVTGAIELAQATAAARPVAKAHGGRWAWDHDGLDDFLQGSGVFFTSGDDMHVIAAGVPTESAANRVMVHCGTSTATPRFPYLGVNASDFPTASWRGDDAVLRQIDSVIPSSARPIVLRASKVGADKKLFVNGIQDGATDTGAVGAIASLTRLRIGSSTTTTGYFQGPMVLVCLAKAMTESQVRAIERLGAFLALAAYRAPRP